MSKTVTRIDTVSLRPITIQDTPNIVRWRNTNSVRVNLFSQSIITEDTHIEWMHRMVETGKCHQYIIQVDEYEESRDIGTTFIKTQDQEKKIGEFGIFIGDEAARGKGYGKAATLQMLETAFQNLKYKSIYLWVYENNIVAIRTYIDAGFKFVPNTQLVQNGQVFVQMNVFADEFISSTSC